MITDDMMNIAADAYYDTSMKDMSNLQLEAPYYDTRPTYRVSMSAALAAAYPIIRDEEIEEAAKAVDRRYMGREDMEVLRCAQAIKDMKEQS